MPEKAKRLLTSGRLRISVSTRSAAVANRAIVRPCSTPSFLASVTTRLAKALTSEAPSAALLTRCSFRRYSASPLNAALWRLRRRGRGFWVIPLDFTCVWTRRVGSGLEPEFGAGRVCGCRDGCEYWG